MAHKTVRADIYIEDEKIHSVGKRIKQNAKTVIDATDRIIFSGGVDAHTHMELPVMGTHSCDSFESGTRAALHGGTTTIIDFANQAKGDSLLNTLKLWQNKAHDMAVCDYGFHISVTDPRENVLSEIESIIKNEGVTSFKTFMAYEKMKLCNSDLARLMREVKKHKGLITTHAEDGTEIDQLILSNIKARNLAPEYHEKSRPPHTEVNAVSDLIKIAKEEKCPVYIVHTSCGESLDEIAGSQNKGHHIFAETCIQYLLLDKSKYMNSDFKESAKFIISPPLRQKEDQSKLWNAIRDGHIQVVATDHCPFTSKQKNKGVKDGFSRIPNGVPGVENRMEILFSEGVVKGKISVNKFVEVTSLNPARLFGLYPKKGIIAVGSDADIVIFNSKKKHTILSSNNHTKCDYSIYQGLELTGKCEKVILRGKLLIDNGKDNIPKGFGNYLPRKIPNIIHLN